MAGVGKIELLHLVPKLSELQLLEITDGLNLKLTKKKKERKEALQNLLVRHITSEEVEDSEDEGLELYNTLLAQVKELVAEDEEEKFPKGPVTKLEEDFEGVLNEMKMTVKSFGGGSGAKDAPAGEISEQTNEVPGSSQKSAGMVKLGRALGTDASGHVTSELHKIKIRDFKISNGTVGGQGSLDYSDLISQIKEGVEMGYGEKEVMAGVRNAAKPGSELRKYLVNHQNMTFSDFKETLREFHNVRESQKIMDEMKEKVQGPQQPLIKYVMAMCAMRDEVLEVMQGEEHQIGEPLVRKRFVESLLSGIRKPTIRLEMQAVFKQNLSDPKLFKEVNLITARDEENEKKLANEGVKVGVKAVEVDAGGKKKGGRTKDDEWREDTSAKIEALTAQVSKLEGLITKVTTANGNLVLSPVSNDPMEQKMASLLGQVQHLTAQMQEYQAPFMRVQGGVSGLAGKDGVAKRVWFKFNKCNVCESENKPVCPHCRKCGEEGHKKAVCPKN